MTLAMPNNDDSEYKRVSGMPIADTQGICVISVVTVVPPGGAIRETQGSCVADIV